MNKPTLIRAARKKDVKSIVKLLSDGMTTGTYATRGEILDGIAKLSFLPSKNAKSIIRQQIYERLRDRNKRVFVAVNENEVVGFVSGNIFKWRGEFYVGYTEDTVVHPKWRGHGIYSKLSKEMEKFYKKSGARYVFFETNPKNKTMMRIGEHQGYKTVSVTMLKKLNR